jgi:hypothetical protein
MVAVVEKAKKISITNESFNNFIVFGMHYEDILAHYAAKTLTMQPYMIGKDRVSFQQWLAVKAWAEKNEYIFLNNGWENGRTTIGVNMAINYPVTSIDIVDAIVWCNAYSEYYGKTPYYRERDNNSKIIKDAKSMKNGFDFSVVDNGGYRLPSREEYCFAVFDGDYRLGSYNSALEPSGYGTTDWKDLRFSDKRIIRVEPIPNSREYVKIKKIGNPISLFTPIGILGLIGLYDKSEEFVEPWVYEDRGRLLYYYLYNRLIKRNKEGFRIACSTMLKQSITKSVTERYTTGL